MTDQIQEDYQLTPNPPYVITVQGPRDCGKSTIIRSLIYHYTRQKIKQVKGSISLRTSKTNRVTFIECPSDIEGMIDVAKITDLALIVVDASVGFEMQTFQFLNILQSHGFPSCMGILTRLDLYKDNKMQRKLKKRMKKRFWKEVYDGAKLFYLSGLQTKGGAVAQKSITKLYKKQEIQNLARYISIIKLKELEWRQTHAYVLADRFQLINKSQSNEDEGNQQNNNQSVIFYGYVRGTDLKLSTTLYLNGVGDYRIKSLKQLDDPVPILDTRSDEMKKRKIKRQLNLKERSMYAPYINTNAMSIDQNAGYISIPDNYVVFTKMTDSNNNVINPAVGQGVQMVRELQMGKGILDTQKTLNRGSNEEDEEEDEMQEQLIQGVGISMKQDTQSNQQNNWRGSLNKKLNNIDAHSKYYEKNPLTNLVELIYGQANLLQMREAQNDHDQMCNNQMDQAIELFEQYRENAMKLDQCVYFAKKRCVTSKNGNDIEESEDDQMKEQEEQLRKLLSGKEQGLIQNSSKVKQASSQGGEDDNQEEDSDQTDQDNDDDDEEGQNSQADNSDDQQKWKRRGQKNNIVTKQQKQRLKFKKQQYGLITKGKYVKIEIDVQKKYAELFTPLFPLILCSIEQQQTSFGFLRTKIQKHRWYPTILKNQDPLIFSVGWRRFQSIPTFLTQDINNRKRMIKYTPKYGWCMSVFYGPYFPVNSPFLALKKLNEEDEQNNQHFRICANGVVLQINHSFKVNKKLKLIGEPFQIHKNTAFIKNMFNSKVGKWLQINQQIQLQVAKYIGAAIRTVSGIRGQIKKESNKGPDGTFRATFQDKILKSDIIFCRTWYSVDIPKFYNPSITYGNNIELYRVRYLKTTSQIRREKQIPIPVKTDSQYKQIERDPNRLFQRLVIPDKLQKQLPFQSKQKVKQFIDQQKSELRKKLQKFGLPSQSPFKIMMSDNEKKVFAMIERLSALSRQKRKQKRAQNQEYQKVKQKRNQIIQNKKLEAQKLRKKKKFYK